MTARIVMRAAAIDEILRRAAAPHIKALADRIAADIVGLAGQPDGSPVTADRDDGDTGARARSAIILHHPTPSGRAAAKRAAEAAMRTNGSL